MPPRTNPPLPETPKGVEWLTVEEAAKRRRVTEQAIRLMCQGWAAAGKAEQRERAEGGKPRWFVRSDASPELSRYRGFEFIPVDTSKLPEKHREAYGTKLAILDAWEEACRVSIRGGMSKDQATALFLQRVEREWGMGLAAATLRRWRRAVRSEKGRAALIDGRAIREEKAKAEDPFMAEVIRLYLHPNKRSAVLCHKLAMQKAVESEWAVCSYRTAAIHIGDIPNAVKIEAREGRKAYTDKAETFIDRDYSSLESNEQWNADHHRFDVWVRTGVQVDTKTGEERYTHARPWLTAWQDVRSRKIVGWEIFEGDPNTDKIIISLSRAIDAHGAPESAWVDNGKDFDSYALHGRTKKERFAARGKLDVTYIHGIFAQLQIKAHNVQPYHGQSKPIERFFGTLEGQFGKLWDSYCGNKPENRPEGLQGRLDAGKAPTMAEFVGKFSQWVEMYNNAPHTGDSMENLSPNRIFGENLHTKRTLSKDVLNVLTFKPGKPVDVTQNGVRWNRLVYGKHDPMLRRYLGKKVRVSGDTKDVSKVHVFTLEGEWLCAVCANERLPANADLDLLSRAMADKRRTRKAELAYKKTRHNRHESPSETMFRLADEQNRRVEAECNPDPLPPMTIRPIRTPIEAQMPEIQRAIQQPFYRKAAGAESFDIIEIGNQLLPPQRPQPVDRKYSIFEALKREQNANFGGGE